MTVEEFVSKWGTGNFPSDGARGITGAKMREFKDDIAATFKSTFLTATEFDTTGSDVSLDLSSDSEKYLYGSDAFNDDKTMILDNDSDAVFFEALITPTTTNVLTFESASGYDIKMAYGSAGWEDSAQTWECYDTRNFIITGRKLNSIWFLTITAY